MWLTKYAAIDIDEMCAAYSIEKHRIEWAIDIKLPRGRRARRPWARMSKRHWRNNTSTLICKRYGNNVGRRRSYRRMAISIDDIQASAWKQSMDWFRALPSYRKPTCGIYFHLFTTLCGTYLMKPRRQLAIVLRYCSKTWRIDTNSLLCLHLIFIRLINIISFPTFSISWPWHLSFQAELNADISVYNKTGRSVAHRLEGF